MRAAALLAMMLLALPARAQEDPQIVHANWVGCWLEVSIRGDVRVRGTASDECIDALDTALKLARAERAVNKQRKK